MKLKEPIANLKAKERHIANRSCAKKNSKPIKMQSPNKLKK